MRILLDNNVNRRFALLIHGHEITHVQEIGWDKLRNGDLIQRAEEEGYEAMITCDKNIAYQQNLVNRRIGLTVLNSLFLKLDHIAPLAPKVQTVLDGELVQGAFWVINSE